MSGNLTFIYDCKTVAMNISNTSYKRQYLLKSTIQWSFMFTADMAEPIEMTCKNKMTVFLDSRAHFLPNKLQEFNEQFTGPH